MTPTTPTSHFDEKDFSRRSRLKAKQVEFFLSLTQELLTAWQDQRASRPLSGLAEYNRFVTGAYACGFVCQDFPPAGPKSLGASLEEAIRRAAQVASLPLQDVRQLVHFLIRRERWNIEMIDEQEGTIRSSLESGLIDVVARRLEALLHRAGG